MAEDKLYSLIYDAYENVKEAEAIAHPAGLRDVLEHLYEAHAPLRRARDIERKRKEKRQESSD